MGVPAPSVLPPAIAIAPPHQKEALDLGEHEGQVLILISADRPLSPLDIQNLAALLSLTFLGPATSGPPEDDPPLT